MSTSFDIDPKQLEAIILQMNANDATMIHQAQDYLSKYLKKPHSVMGFLIQIQHSSQVYVRQMASVLMKKKIISNWPKIDVNTQNMLKQELVRCVVSDPDRLVRRAIATLIATISKILLPKGEWNELFGFIHQLTQSKEETHRELAMLLFFCLTDCVGEHMTPHFPQLVTIFLAALQDQSSLKVRVMAMKASCKLLDYLAADKEVLQFQVLLRPMIQVLKLCLETGEETTAVEFLTDFSDLAESPLPLLGDSIPDLIRFLLEALLNESLELTTRDSISYVINRIIETKPKYIGKNKLLLEELFKSLLIIISKDSSSAGGMMSSRFSLMEEQEERSNKVEDDEDDEDCSPTQIAQRTLDIIALNIPSKYVLPIALNAASHCSTLSDVSMRKASAIMLGVISEGCADPLREKIKEIIPYLYTCARDLSSSSLREAACFALGQWAEHLQPEILDHYDELLPIIFTLLDDSISTVQATSCYVLECFTENMSKETVAPYLDSLVKKLAHLLTNSKSTSQIKLMAISAIGSTAVGAETLFEPYFNDIARMIQPFLTLREPKLFSLRGRALECMGYMAIAVEKECYRPILMESMHYALEGLQPFKSSNTITTTTATTTATEEIDMELADYSFAFFCNISKVYEKEFTPFLERLVPLIISCCLLEDGTDQGSKDINEQEEEEEDEEYDDDDDDEEGKYISIRTAMLDMKTGAVGCLEALAENCGSDFNPFLPVTLNALLHLVEYFHESIRSNVVGALSQLVIVSSLSHTSIKPWKKADSLRGDEFLHVLPLPVSTLLDHILPIILGMLDDIDSLVVIKTCEGLIKIIDELGPCSIYKHYDQLIHALEILLKEEGSCQASYEEEEDETVVEEEEEEGGSLIESVCDVYVSIAKAFGSSFINSFTSFLPLVLRFTKSIRPPKDRSMAFGAIAEICLELDSYVLLNCSFLEELVNTTIRGLNDSSPLVLQNCAYCIGILVEKGGKQLIPLHLNILRSLRPLFDQTKEEYASVVDNACAAIARMIQASPETVPLDQVLPFLLSSLPLKEDLTENSTIFNCIFDLLQQRNQVIMGQMPNLLRIFADVLSDNVDGDEILQQKLIVCLKSLFNEYNEQMQHVLNGLPEDKRGLLLTRLTA